MPTELPTNEEQQLTPEQGREKLRGEYEKARSTSDIVGPEMKGWATTPVRAAAAEGRTRRMAQREEQRTAGLSAAAQGKSPEEIRRDRAKREQQRREERWRQKEKVKIAGRGALGEAAKMPEGISLPIGIMLVFFAVLLDILDLFDAIPIIGTIITLMMSAGGVVLWILYWLAGARGLAKAIIMLLAYIAEMIPVVGLFPINTIVAVAVYLISQPWFLSAVIGAVGLAGAAGRLGGRVVGAFGGLAGARKPAEETA